MELSGAFADARSCRKLAKLRPSPAVAAREAPPCPMPGRCRRLSSIRAASGGADLPSPVSLPILGPAAFPPMNDARDTGPPPEVPGLAVPVGPAAPPYRARRAEPRCCLPGEEGEETLLSAVSTSPPVADTSLYELAVCFLFCLLILLCLTSSSRPAPSPLSATVDL